MIFVVPWVLLALVLLPVLWWLLRATPPAPRDQNFPAIRLLAGLRPAEETPARTPWWLLALRLAAAAAIIVGLARPVLTSGKLALDAPGPILLAIDNDWASAPDWPARLAAADAVLDLAARNTRTIRLLTTAPTEPGATPRLLAAQPAATLRPLVAALRPMPWPRDDASAARTLANAAPGPVFLIASPTGYAKDGDANPSALAAALAAIGPSTILSGAAPARLLSAQPAPDGLFAALRQTPGAPARDEAVLALTGDGRVLARTKFPLAAGQTEAKARIDLPPELRNQLTALELAGAPGAGSVALLDEASRRRPVGIAGGPGGGSGDTPLLGDTFYIDRALAPSAELRHGSIAGLLARPLSMLVVADQMLTGADAEAVDAWVKHGGLLLRFAGPALGEADADTLLPVHLLDGARRLGGAMSWSKPMTLAPFPAGSAFAGLAIPGDVEIQRQMLADPSSSPQGGQEPTRQAETWAALADGTPLVTTARHGDGRIVFFHVTANADWSNLPLSGLFVDMLTRLVARSAGIAGDAAGAERLPPLQTLDGNGVLGTPPAGAQAIAATALASTRISDRNPPGFYGSAAGRRALNLGDRTTLLPPAPLPPGATALSLEAAPRDTELAQPAVALGLLLLLADLIATLVLRGLLPSMPGWPGRGAALSKSVRRAAGAGGAALLLACLATAPASAAENPALATHLAYVVTGDAAIDAVSKAGLAGLSDYVNGRTAAALADPVAVTPGQDDLSFYPLLYFPVSERAAASPKSVAALNDYMSRGGIVVIDLRGGGGLGAGSGAGQAPDTHDALRRLVQGMDIPALAPLTSAHVLSRAFYLLADYPGRYDGDTVWVQRAQDRSNDSVSPVIIGSNDWAAAWAQDEDGRPLYAVVPGGARQRTLAYRFGVNLVMYALTGNYKGDQVHVPAILERLGQ